MINKVEVDNQRKYLQINDKSGIILHIIRKSQVSLQMVSKLCYFNQERSDEMAPLMRFLTSALTSPKYHAKLLPILSKISERYAHYTENFSKVLNVPVEQIAPYVYIGITAAANYMIFGDNSFIKPQFDLIKEQYGGIYSDAIYVKYRPCDKCTLAIMHRVINKDKTFILHMGNPLEGEMI